MDSETRHAVRELLVGFMEEWLADATPGGELERIREEGVSPSGLLAPFHDALVPGITLLRERAFSTRLGNLHERIAVVIGQSVHAEVNRGYSLRGSMPALAREFISQRLNALEAQEVSPDVFSERRGLLETFGQQVTDSTTIDLRILTTEGEEHFFEIKSPKPNKGQCIEMKERLMKAIAIRGSESAWAWWGVPYDPYGTGAYSHPYPLRFFDFANEVKVGRDFWDFIGADDGTYEDLLSIYQQVGASFAERLRSLLTRPA